MNVKELFSMSHHVMTVLIQIQHSYHDLKCEPQNGPQKQTELLHDVLSDMLAHLSTKLLFKFFISGFLHK